MASMRTVRVVSLTIAVMIFAIFSQGCNKAGDACGDSCTRAFTECQSVFEAAGVPAGSTAAGCVACCIDEFEDPLVQALVNCLNSGNSCQSCVDEARLLDFNECS
jgi:hypothetical protein